MLERVTVTNELRHALEHNELELFYQPQVEIVSGIINGWNFGDGHFHDDQLIAAVQERCEFAEGDLRVVVLEGQPIHRQRQHYWIYDAARGLLEEGWVDVAEMVKRGPWLEESYDFPVEVVGGSVAQPVTA